MAMSKSVMDHDNEDESRTSCLEFRGLDNVLNDGQGSIGAEE
jgi:hypothetical protein